MNDILHSVPLLTMIILVVPLVLVWAVIIVGVAQTFVFQQGAINARIYRDDDILQIIRANAGAMGPNFLLVDDNGPVHREKVVQDCLDTEGFRRMDCSPDPNPIEHLWDQLRRAMQRRLRPPTNQ
ncbi:uncharacterized protein [Palaemon carinicauda]|uniref:uncharacterized protein n=1 Tax=Palaemon carinicauda TaxID=392227 RepID=UPI0035B57AEF